MSGEHVGRVADAIDNGDGGAVARMMKAAKPTGRAYRPDGHDNGNGDRCHVEGHGRMYVLKGGTQWCPHQSHDMGVPRNG